VAVLLDFESRSRCDLKARGGRNYWEDSTTRAISCVSLDTDTGDVGLWLPGEPPPSWTRDPHTMWAAHNASGFDRFAMVALGWTTLGDDYIDTSEAARIAGKRGALDALSEDADKDTIGSAITKSLSRTQVIGNSRNKKKGTVKLGVPQDLRPAFRVYHRALKLAIAAGGELEWPDIPDEIINRVIPYNASDVEVMAHEWPVLESWLQLEPEVRWADRRVNDRGVGFDSQLARRLLEEDARNAAIVCERAARELGGAWTAENVRDVANSPKMFCAYTGSIDAKKETIEDILVQAAFGRAPKIARVLAEVRQAVASIARGKLEAGLARVSPDGRLRDSHRYYGAHTGRWSGRGMQLQNMPRPEKRFEDFTDDDICRLADAVLAGRHADQGEIDLLLRACLIARPGHTFVDFDFSGVESRGTAWVAGDTGALGVFASGRDPYKVMAATIFGCRYEDIGKDERRQIGKIAELACGYGMGAEKFEWTANKALAAERKGSLDSIGVDAADVVHAWRDLHHPIRDFWYELERAFSAAVQGVEAECSVFRCMPSDDGKDVAIFLPSGRPIVYHDTKASRGERGRVQLSYLGDRGRTHIYGGKLTENVIQALCRDLMAEALVKAERAGLDPVLHEHDAIETEVPIQAEAEGREYLKAIMLDLPDWAEGFPIDATGHTGKRHRK
jgi:DNA polymerase